MISMSFTIPYLYFDLNLDRSKLHIGHETRASEPVGRVIQQVQQRQKEEELETALFEGCVPNLSKDSNPLRL